MNNPATHQMELVMEAKERRMRRQQRLFKAYRLPLVSFTLNLPGGYAYYDTWASVWQRGRQELEKMFPDSLHTSSRVGLWGPETFLALPRHPHAIKEMTVKLEEQHSLGRVFDIDVICQDGVPFSRSRLGKPPRQCVLCQCAAVECYVNKTHPLEEIQEKVSSMIKKGLSHP